MLVLDSFVSFSASPAAITYVGLVRAWDAHFVWSETSKHRRHDG